MLGLWPYHRVQCKAKSAAFVLPALNEEEALALLQHGSEPIHLLQSQEEAEPLPVALQRAGLFDGELSDLCTLLRQPAPPSPRRTILLAIAFYIDNQVFSSPTPIPGQRRPYLRAWQAISPYVLILVLPALGGRSTLASTDAAPLEAADGLLQILLATLASQLAVSDPAALTRDNNAAGWKVIEYSQRGYQRAKDELERLPLEPRVKVKLRELLHQSARANDVLIEMSKPYRHLY
ncbi:hypothetical protein JCM11251_004769 [Rhodosporidiobolus azoricus]